MAMQKILVEICCGSLQDALEAEGGGADRVELCSALFLGGLTPSLGTIMEAKARLKIPIMVMIRSRAGGFCYTEPEMAVMERDTVLAAQQGAEGMVFGILNADGSIDEERCRRMRKLIGARQAVFHRAFDVTPDPFRSLDQLVALGFTRVLTSGQEDTVAEGAHLIKRLIEYAGDRIEILPGGGIKPLSLRQVVESTGCKQVHLTAFKTQSDTSVRGRPFVTFGGALCPPEDQYQVADRYLVERVVRTLKE
ncbi:MAG: copper homeostasis protein CutC [Terriglobia bacterium]|jgi:copper homeostasis protein